MISIREDGGNGSLSAFEQEIHGIFSEQGKLSHGAGFEFRKEQQDMACAVARTLEQGRQIVVEAGTGVGKSLAYLVPAALHAIRTKRKAVISTHTISLQEQLIFKDIPFVQNLLDEDFEALLMKGRQNYLCATRLARALAHAADLFTTEQKSELERIRDWSLTTKDGSLSDFLEQPDPAVWEEVRSEQHLCTPKMCGQNSGCHYQALRRRIAGAHMVVLNHALFFTLLGAVEDAEHRTGGLLFANDFVIFDEAHTIEEVASRHIGQEVSQLGLRRAIQRLYNPRTKRGLFQFLKNGSACKAVADILPASDSFFQAVTAKCSFKKGRDFRIREAGWVDGGEVCTNLARLGELIATESARCKEEISAAELQDAARKLRSARAAITDFLALDHPDHVYWVEKIGRQEQFCTLRSAPVDLADALRRLLFREGACSVLTSATLSVGSPDLTYFRQRIGAEDVSALQIGSPFDYEKQMQLHLVRQMPDPKDAGYETALEKWIAHFTDKSLARAFVLFTSYQTMRAVSEKMEPHFAKKGWPLLVQGTGMPAQRMIREFRENSHSVLFGVSSFWTGVDVPGDALSSVIITRLPFATPDHPLTEARLEAIESEGGRAFESYSLPEAILRLRQGVGRLIRSKSDTGTVVILDSRIVNKPYGKSFLRAMPKCPVEIH
ncbi:MAG: DEAD/DEAH box helicase [Chthoniobacterales bacterium]|nr:DEAD/DEAH box helicase [Chthoniobacterales bacterium]